MMFEAFLPLAGAFSGKSRSALARDLAQAGMRPGAEEYLSIAMGASFAASALSLASIAFLGPEYSLLAAALVFCLAFFAFLRYPSHAKARRAGAVERELPMALRMVSAELLLGVSFEGCLEGVARADYGALSGEFRAVMQDIRSGMPVPQALALLSRRVGSEHLERAVAHLASCYSSGSGADTLKRVAEGLAAEQRSKIREYNGKFAMYSLFFISVSAVVPAVFQALVTVGSSFLEMSFTPEQAMLIPAAGFPALSAAILLMLQWRRPRFL